MCASLVSYSLKNSKFLASTDLANKVCLFKITFYVAFNEGKLVLRADDLRESICVFLNKESE